MSAPKYLIDTNVFVGAEDVRAIEPAIARLLELANRHRISVFIHQAAKDDIKQDRNEARRSASLSKVDKYPIIATPRDVTEATLAATYGPLAKRNDVVDATLLQALDAGAADVLVTQDRKLRARARKHASHLEDRVLFVADAVALLERTYEPSAVPVRHVEEVKAYEIPKGDEIFESLREGYADFDDWWERCCRDHRPCWVVYDDDTLAGLVVRKDETGDDTDAQTSASKILKVCTFKVRPERRGTKLGELLLRQVLWFAANNGYELVYVTTFPEQQALIDLLEEFGFDRTKEKSDGELVYEKPFYATPPDPDPNSDLYELARVSYPAIPMRSRQIAYAVPIQEAWHDVLFPDLDRRRQGDLFSVSGQGAGPRRPGNTIRKVYICHTGTTTIERGVLLAFYKCKSAEEPSQAVTAFGIAEGLRLARSTEEVVRLTGGRSVYTRRQIEEFGASMNRPVKVIDFLLVGYAVPPMKLNELRSDGVFTAPPQSITKLSAEKAAQVANRLALTLDMQD